MDHSNNKTYNLWGGRFTQDNDSLMKLFNKSILIDKRLWKQDLKNSKEWSSIIAEKRLLTKQEVDLIHDGLTQIYDEWFHDSFEIKSNDEDIHTANERRLKEIIGDVAMKLHTGRSRNDQVATDMKLWLVDNISELRKSLLILIQTLVNRAHEEIDILMPGYTHLQRAQPIRWSHLLLSYVSALDRDHERVEQFESRTNSCPLGSGAIAGNPFGIDRNKLAANLGFKRETINSIDSIQSRDFIYEFLFICSSIGINLSKLAEDLIIYSSKEFSFIELSDSYSTGSSLMPQKKNPDSLELIRGKSGRLFGRLSGYMMTLKGLPTSYNKDLQEDKENMFDSFDTTLNMIKIADGVLRTLKVNKEKMLNALSVDLLSTDIAYYLVRKGIPFRQAHSIAGRCVSLAESTNSKLNELTLEQLKQISDTFENDIYEVYNFESSVEQYASLGGTAKSSIEKQIFHFKNKFLF